MSRSAIDAAVLLVAYSYIRFSTPEQRKGNSLKRQLEDAAAWCARNKARLDTSTSFRDLGKSAFLGAHRKNPDRNALASFLGMVEQGKVQRGSYLIIENLDRLTREDIQPALLLVLGLLQAGIRIVQLKPVEMVFDDKSDAMAVMMMIMELNRGHSESAMKSGRNGAAWRSKVECARNGARQPPRRKDGRVTRTVSDRLPAWLEVRGGKPETIPERAAVVKLIFKLAANGYGVTAVVKYLTEKGIPAFGDREEYLDENGERHYRAKAGGHYGAGVWNRTYIAQLLTDRRALGEYQPCGTGRKPDGDPIKGYFPAVVTEEEWAAARAGAIERTKHKGRVGKQIPNVFAGLLRNARVPKDTFFISTLARASGLERFLQNTAGCDGRERKETFPAETFERAVFSLLREIDPRDVLDGNHEPDETTALFAELNSVEASIASISAEMDAHGESPTLYARVRAKEARRAELVKLLAAAQEKVAHPLSESWDHAQTLLKTLDAAPDPLDARLRLRTALRRIVESVWLLIVPRGKDRLCAVQVWFAGGKRRRDYIVLNRPPMASHGKCRPGMWLAESLADAVPDTGDFDLRKPGAAGKLEYILRHLNVEAYLARHCNGDGRKGQ